MKSNSEPDRYVEDKSRQIVSSLAFARLKSLVTEWEREDRAKSKFVLAASLWFAGALGGGAVLSWLTVGSPVPGALLGFILWVVAVLVLLRKYFSPKT